MFGNTVIEKSKPTKGKQQIKKSLVHIKHGLLYMDLGPILKMNGTL